MQRITVTLDDDLMSELDRVISERGYANRSEAIRDLTRAGLSRARVEASPDAQCVAALVYTYDHHSREVSKKLSAAHHEHHDITVSSLHVHMDRDTCLEVSVLKGTVAEVRHFTDHLTAQRRIRNGEVVIIPATSPETATSGKSHGQDAEHGHAHPHSHDH